MSKQLTNEFLSGLKTLEESKDTEPLTRLYSVDASIGNVIAPDQFHGPQGAEKFWKEYRSVFETVKSEFRNIIIVSERAALEWTTEGTSLDGKPMHYAGVTLLEMNGGKITRSCAYFNPRTLGSQMTDDAQA